MLHTREEVIQFIENDSGLRSLAQRVEPRLQNDPGHDLNHSYRVALWTFKLGAGKLSPRHAIAAALLHDSVNVPKNSPDRSRASELSAALAREWLPDHSFSPDEIETIADAIRTHSFSRGETPTTLLGKALQDADRLEALGAIGVMRTVSTGVLLKAQYFDGQDPWAKNRKLDDSRNSTDHFFVKILKLPDSMQTTAGKTEALRRAKTIQNFLKDLGEELGDPIPGRF